jgi:hypothetical protein
LIQLCAEMLLMLLRGLMWRCFSSRCSCRLDPVLVDAAWLSRHELRLVQSLKHNGWTSTTSTSSSSSGSSATGYDSSSGSSATGYDSSSGSAAAGHDSRAEGGPGGRQRNQSGSSSSSRGRGRSKGHSRPSHVSNMHSLKAAVGAGLTPAVARQLLGLYAVCSYDMKDVSVRQLCQQLINLEP